MIYADCANINDKMRDAWKKPIDIDIFSPLSFRRSVLFFFGASIMLAIDRTNQAPTFFYYYF